MNIYSTDELIKKYLDTEHDISCVYELLSQCKDINDINEYNYLKKELKKLLRAEEKILSNEEFEFELLTVYASISSLYKFILNDAINGKKSLTKLNELHMVMERIESQNIGLDMENSERRIKRAFTEDLIKKELILVKDLINNETDENKKRDLLSLYYSLISCSPKLESQFLADEKLLDIPENNLLEVKKLYPIDYEVFNRLNFLGENIYNGINIFLNGYSHEDINDENKKFYFNLIEMRMRTCISALSNPEYIDLKNSAFEDLELIDSEGREKIKEIFSYRNKDRNNSKVLGLYTSRNVK